MIYQKYNFTEVEVFCGCFDSSAIFAVLMGFLRARN